MNYSDLLMQKQVIFCNNEMKNISEIANFTNYSDLFNTKTSHIVDNNEI